MKNLKLLLALIVAISISTTGCYKDDILGPTGEQGPAGPRGADGEDGTDGTDGANGANGSNGTPGAQGPQGNSGAQGPQGPQGPAGEANVIYSPWFTDLDWADSTLPVELGNEIITRACKNASAVTKGILDSGIVLSYVRHQTLIAPQLLPYTFSTDPASGDPTKIHQLNVAPLQGKLLYFVSNSVTKNASSVYPTGDFEFRYIIIPGNVLAGGRVKHPSTMTYAEICTRYNIPR